MILVPQGLSEMAGDMLNEGYPIEYVSQILHKQMNREEDEELLIIYYEEDYEE